MSEHDASAPHRDRRLGLAVFGGTQILIGLACAALVPMTLIGMAVSSSLDPRTVVPSMVLYTVIAAFFIALGVGSIRARRWARALSLSLSWLWLITGICTMLLVWLAMPTLWRDLAIGSGLEEQTADMVAVGMNLLLSFIYVLLPGAFVLFYRSPDVIATCRARDPGRGWIARCPHRLLTLAMVWALCGLSVVAVPSYGWVFPFFGVLLSGAIGAACWGAVVALCTALAWGTCRRAPWAWWTAVAACVAAAISSVVTFARLEPETVFADMGLTNDQLLVMEMLWPREPWIHAGAWLAIWGSLVGYLVVVRRHFEPPLGRGESEP